MSTILIGVDASRALRGRDRLRPPPRRRLERPRRRGLRVPVQRRADPRGPTRPTAQALADDAEQTARDMRDRLDGNRRGAPADQDHGQPLARARPPRPRRGRARRAHRRRLLPHRPAGTRRAGKHRRATAARRAVRRRGRPARLPHARASQPIRRIGVAYDGSDEATAAVAAAVELARALSAELEIIGVVAPETYAAAGMMGGDGLRDAARRHRALRPGRASTPSSPACPTTSRPRACGSRATRPTSSASAARGST